MVDSIITDDLDALELHTSLDQIKRVNGARIDVKELYYSIKIGNEEYKSILNGVSFCLTPGSMCALLGPSGSGKSTLLDLLADRKYDGMWSGEISFNHGPRSKFFNRDCAYILQDNVHFATLTVRETIYFGACFRLPEGTAVDEFNRRVDELLNMMGLSNVQDTLVGDQTQRGISGGQMKRLSIAVEMASLPELIFLDEPTSGLDSSMALDVMTAVRELANQNRTCLCTIHQPSPAVFALFDSLLVLCNGRLVYNGPSKEVVRYFSSLNYVFHEGHNPAEFIIDIAEGVIKPSQVSEPLSIEELESLYLKSEYCYAPALENDLVLQQKVLLKETQKEDLHLLLDNNQFATSSWFQFKVLCRRTVLTIRRDVPEIAAQLAKNAIVGLLIGVIFYQQADVQNPLFGPLGVPFPCVQTMSSVLFFGTMYTLLANIHSIPFLCSRNLIFRRELASNAYSVGPYWLSHVLTAIPVQFIVFTFFGIAIYFLCKFRQTVEYFWYIYSLLFLASLNSYYAAMFLAAALGHARLALTIFPMIFMFFATFSGFSPPPTHMPVWWAWACKVDYIRWIFQGLMVNQWEDFPDDGNIFGGPKKVLGMYGMSNFNKFHAYWISILVTMIAIFLIYFAMQPPRRTIEKLPMETLKGQASTQEPTPSQKTVMSPGLNRARSFRIDTSGFKPLEGYYLTFRNVSYQVKNRQTGRMLQVLTNVSGRVEPNEMCALMGSSGAGKSTLLDILALRKTMGEISGEIFINGKLRTRAMMKSTAYVMQDNAHYPTLTVEETIYFAAQLRLPQSMNQAEKNQRIREIIKLLGLDHVKNSYVGDEAERGISGGQKKRLSIGVEIIHFPEMIFLDEPTTGLDSATAYDAMYIVRELANQHRTIICSLHQPSVQTFELFDKVMLLGAGQVLYFGAREGVVNYFTHSVYVFPYADANPADYMIAIASQGVPSPAKETGIVTTEELIQMFHDNSMVTGLFHELDTSIEKDTLNTSSVGTSSDQGDQKYYKVPQLSITNILPINEEEMDFTEIERDTTIFLQIPVLCYRFILCKIRDPITTLIMIGRYLIIGFFFGTVWYNLSGGTDSLSYMNRLCVFFIGLLVLLLNHQEDIPALHGDRLVFYRERGTNLYSIFAYWAARVCVSLPFDVFNVFLFTISFFFLSGLKNGSFGFFFLIFWMADVVSLFTNQLLAFLSPTTEMAMSFLPIMLFFAASFAGFIVYVSQFPSWLVWATDLSYMRYAFQALILNEFQNNEKLPLAQEYIDMLGLNALSKEECASFLAVALIIHGFVAYLAIRVVNFEKR